MGREVIPERCSSGEDGMDQSCLVLVGGLDIEGEMGFGGGGHLAESYCSGEGRDREETAHLCASGCSMLNHYY